MLRRQLMLCRRYAPCYAVVMATKNRVIRIDDELWCGVTAEAKRRNISVAELVRSALASIADTPLCFHCGSAATHLIEQRLTPGDELSPDERVAVISSIGDLVDTRTPVQVHVYTCDEHYEGAIEFFVDTCGLSTGRGLIRIENPKSDYRGAVIQGSSPRAPEALTLREAFSRFARAPEEP